MFACGIKLDYGGSRGWNGELVYQIGSWRVFDQGLVSSEVLKWRCAMAACIKITGILSFLLAVLFGVIISDAAPFAEGTNFVSDHSAQGELIACRGKNTSTISGKGKAWEETCRSVFLPRHHASDRILSFHQDVVWGELGKQSQLAIDESFGCTSESGAMTLNTSSNCIFIGAPWLKAVTDIPTISDTFQSLFEFELSEPGRKRIEPSEEILSYENPGMSPSIGVMVSDELDFSKVTNLDIPKQLLGTRTVELKTFVYSNNDYKIEASDTMTRFIPISMRNMRGVEIGDLVSLLLLLLLLPDYRKLKIYFRRAISN